MNVRLAAWMAPRPVPARIATTQKWPLVTTKKEATVTSAHCTRLIPTTKRGPRASVGPAHAAEPSSAVTCTTMKRAMISVNVKPSVLAANTPAKVITRSEEHTSELQSLAYLVCRLLLEKKK